LRISAAEVTLSVLQDREGRDLAQVQRCVFELYIYVCMCVCVCVCVCIYIHATIHSLQQEALGVWRDGEGRDLAQVKICAFELHIYIDPEP
jgi:type IV secretory pathway protease TraF